MRRAGALERRIYQLLQSSIAHPEKSQLLTRSNFLVCDPSTQSAARKRFVLCYSRERTHIPHSWSCTPVKPAVLAAAHLSLGPRGPKRPTDRSLQSQRRYARPTAASYLYISPFYFALGAAAPGRGLREVEPSAASSSS